MARRGFGGRGRSGRGGRGRGGLLHALISFIVIIAVLAAALAALKATGNTSIEKILSNARQYSQEISSGKAFSKLTDRAKNLPNCNLLDKNECIEPVHGHAPANDRTGNPPIVGTESRQSSENGDNGAKNAPQDEPKTVLDKIPVADAENVSYSRKDYRHWILQNGACDTREIVLHNAGFASDARTCKALQGKAVSPYTGETVTNPRSMDIDHVIPLGYANAHGGAHWDSAKKQAFANDLTQLLAVDAASNRQKGDKGPADWTPKDKSFGCKYANIWVNTALKYGLTITQADKDVLKQELASCGK